MREAAPYTVSAYLGLINEGLLRYRATVSGEVSSIDIRGNYLFFKLKDKNDESVLSCFMWRRSYDACAIELEEGMLIAVEGVPEVYKARGTFTFQGARIALLGEGPLKKAYDDLNARLAAEGMFAEENKRALPVAPKRIGLITSKTGAVIHDFLNNIGQWGFEINFYDSRVEGQFAVPDLLAAVAHFREAAKKYQLDALVIVRGGGSLESLAAFNHEPLVRAIAEFPVPVIAGIGHDKDVPLLALAADRAVSTPTAAAEALNRLFENEYIRLESLQTRLSDHAQEAIRKTESRIARAAELMGFHSSALLNKGREQEERFIRSAGRFGNAIAARSAMLAESGAALAARFESRLAAAGERLSRLESAVDAESPLRALRLGYSIIRAGSSPASAPGAPALGQKVIRSIKDAPKGAPIALQVSDGTIDATVTSTRAS